MIKWIFILCALAVIAGCGQSVGSVSTGTSSVASKPVTFSAPEWASTFTRCAGLLGKSKDDVVAAIGPPASTFGLGNQMRYDYTRNGYKMSLTFEEPRGLTEVGLGFDGNRLSAKDVWEGLNGPGTKPDTFQADDKIMAEYWQGNSPYDYVLIALNGSLAGTGPVQVNGRMIEPILKGEKRFDTTANCYIIGPLSPNPHADWRSVQVDGIQTGVHKSGMFTGNYGPDHPIFQNGN